MSDRAGLSKPPWRRSTPNQVLDPDKRRAARKGRRSKKMTEESRRRILIKLVFDSSFDHVRTATWWGSIVVEGAEA